MTYRLMLLDSVKYDVPNYRCIGRNFDNTKQAHNFKRGYSFERSGIMVDAVKLAKDMNLRTPWKIEEDK